MKNRKGKMPSALAKYWATHRRPKKKTSARKVGQRKPFVRKARKSKYSVEYVEGQGYVRHKNPRAAYHLALKQKDGSRLFYAGGDKFSSKAKAASFSSIDAVKIVARRMLSLYPDLRKYVVLAVPA